MATCSICGAEASADMAYCPKCGNKRNRPGDIGPPPGPSAAASSLPAAGNPDPLANRIREHHDSGPQRTDTVEKELWTGTYSPKAMVGPLVGGAVWTIAVVVLWIVFSDRIGDYWWAPLAVIALTWLYLGAAVLFRRLSVRYRLTNQRFFHERGILSRTVDRIEVIDMDDITYVQGIFDRMLGSGTIKITSSDRTHPELLLIGIDDVKNVAALVDDAKRAERVKRGLHIEQI